MKKHSKTFINFLCCFVVKKKNRHHIREKYTKDYLGKKPVLLCFFNRPYETKSVFEQIRLAQPPRLYLVSDGARKFVEGETELVDDLRNWILANVDWPCEVKTLFREKNIGCGPSCSGGITWFFENEESGIILEDDCVPCQSFFTFCNELLDKYKNNKRIWGISGNNYDVNFSAKETYLFTRLTSGWGWATWANRWDKFNFNLTGWNNKFIKKFHPAKKVRDFYYYMFDRKKKVDGGWAFQWQLCVMKYKGLFIHPTKNMVTNIGVNGTSYTNAYDDIYLNIPKNDFDKIIHPKRIKEDRKYLNFQLKLYCDYDC